MARDLRPGTAGPAKPPKPSLGAQTTRQDIHATVHPPVAPPRGKPQPALQRLGFLGPIEEFNNRVERAVLSHRKIRGFDPPPGLALDLARSQVPDTHFEDMLKMGSSTLGRSVAAIGSVGQVKSPQDELLEGLKKSLKDGSFADWNKANGDQLTELGKEDEGFAKEYVPLLLKGFSQRYQSSGPSNTSNVFARAFRLSTLATDQVVTGVILGPPTLAWEEGKAGYHDVGAAVHGHVPTHLAKTNVKLAKGVVKGAVQDVRHPGENPGFLLLDVFGLVSGGTGLVTRVGRAGAAVARHEGAATAAKALVQRPRGGRIEMRKGDHTEERLGSENMLVNAVQRIKAKTSNARMGLRSEGESAGVLSIVRPLAARDFLERHFEPVRKVFGDEAKMRREGDARRRVEHSLSMMLKGDLEKTAGWGLHNARAWDSLPPKMRKGLTVGEQKALQVITLDDPRPMKWWTDFHHRQINMGVGDEAAHRAHLAALKLAQKTIDNPSKRFKAAANKYYEVIAETERLRIQELGLSPDLAERRVINAGRIVRGEDLLKEGEATPGVKSPTAAYTPFFSKEHTKRRPSERGTYFEARQGPYGLSIPQDLSELHHQFTGDSIKQGDFRIDATTLAGEGYARTVRLTEVRKQHKDIWDMSVPTKLGSNMQAIRDVRDVPPELKKTVLEIEGSDLTGKEVEGITPKDLDALRTFLYPERVTQADNVRWFDPALLTPDHPPSPTVLRQMGGYLNEPFRFTTLFLRPAYLLNAVGNAGMAVLHQGHHAPPNMVRAIKAKDFYGEKVSRALDTLAGETKTKSYSDNRIKLASHVIARGWSFVADQFFRRAAVIHELKRMGYDIPLRKLTAEERTNLEKVLSNKAEDADRKNVVEAARRANKAMVEFDNLTWFEREYIKHFIFVYPWVSRSLVWSVRSIVEHPIKADILAQVGHEMDQEHPELYSKVPEWFAKTGYIPVGFDKEGNPKVVNATSVNSFSTMAQMLQTVQAGFVDGSPGSEFDSAFGLMGPMTKFLIHGVTGKDEFGNPYPGSDWQGAATDVLKALPQYAAYVRGGKKNKPLSTGDISNREQLVKRLNENMRRTVFSPGWADGYGMLVTGGLTPRTPDKDVLVAKYWADATPEKRHSYEKLLIHKAIGLQGELLKQKVPVAVRESVDIGLEMAWRHKLQTKELGRTPTELERTQSDIAYLTSINKIPKAEAGKLAKKAKTFTDPADLSRFHSALVGEFSGSKDLQEWDADVRFVASFTKPILEARLKALGDHTVLKRVTASQEDLYEAGRQALAYRRKVKELRDETKDLPRAESDVKLAEFRAWQDAQDKPIKVNGKVVSPSPVRLAWAELTGKERSEHIRSFSQRSWGSLSNFDKELVGKKVPSKVSAGWALISELKAEYKAKNYTAVQSDQVLGLVKQMDKRDYPGMLQDYLFSLKPTIRRLEVLRPYTSAAPEIRSKFNSLIGDDARKAAAGIASGNYVSGDIRQSWTTYVNGPLQEDLAKPEYAALRSWLEPFGPNFLSSLIGR